MKKTLYFLKAKTLLLQIILVSQIVNGLSQDLREFRATFNPEDPFNNEWLDKLHDHLMTKTDQETF